MDRINTCSLCCEVYTKTLRPRVLPCGHTYCTDCLQKLFLNKSLSCPTCQRPLPFADVNEISINFELEKCLSVLANLQSCMNTKFRSHRKGKGKHTLIEEQKSNAQEQQILVESLQKQLCEYDNFLCSSSKEHKEAAQKLQALATQHEIFAEEMEQEKQKVGKFQMEVEKYSKDLKENLQVLDDPSSVETGMDAAIGKVVQNIWELDEWIDNCPQSYPNNNITSSRKILLKSLESLPSIIAQENDGGKETLVPLQNDLTILERVAVQVGKEISFHDISTRLKDDPWKERISSGQLIAVSSKDGRQRFADISVKEDKIYLHCLKDGTRLSSPYKVKHSEVIDCLDKNETAAFMDLSWNGSYKGRIHILLSPDTPLARQFRILCTGDLGHTYAHTNMFKFCGDWLHGGDYKCNKGSCGKSIIEGINVKSSVYTRKQDPGIITCYENVPAQFAIFTSPWSSGNINCAFGKVQDGFLLLRDALRRMEKDKVKDVEICDCGVVLPV